MKFPIIRIRDNGLKDHKDRIVGTNVHDHLYIQGNAIHYLNTQCMAGTEYEDEGYSFVTHDDTPKEYTAAYAPQVEWATLDEIIDMEMERIEETTKNKISLYRALKKKWDEEGEKVEQETGIKTTGGAI